MRYFTDYRDHVGSSPTRFFKTTLFQSPRILVGMDCLEPGQSQEAHVHTGRDKCYFVIEGTGTFTIGEETCKVSEDMVVWAPADVIHSVVNTGSQRLVMLIGMAPEPG
ncbi:MAG: cupin domain-containing protein [Chloroflexi bacterium AL-W]|nr:cupin domain-containing protein [Chloroflexi bacterium AL-N1]NOK65087.1 cupin domain-containing protein [Chloroflexi bacterium AL-N10]NOK72646.1 cupin domain-containing protein [Chloroflexi bacterium AL-N5]NOK79266.1 cupin domain-containing protein [Chloroflexi bacterium AL-W]NOK87182.1 cupin domain-containing protein [Chloroflexi bacterium AL-N15]